MNHQLWMAVGARVLALTFVIAGAAACGEKLSDTTARAPSPNPASPSAVVVGQAPSDPTPQTTQPPGVESTVSKQAENLERPKEGDNHSYSTVAPVTPQKANGVDPQQSPERKSQ